MHEAAHIVTRTLAVNIPVGDHVTRKIGGITFNLDTIWTTFAAGAIVLGMGFYLRHKAIAGVPGKLQIFWELIVGWVGDQVEQSLGPKYRHVVPLAVSIFMLVLVADWLEILPGLYHNTDYSPAPTADVNLTYALGFLVFILTNAASIRAKGFGGYIKYFFRKPRVMTPLHILEELAKPLTLALRLFGNLFSGGIMIALLISFPLKFAAASLVFTPAWKLFDMFIGVIQAFIFALLTILYYQFAVEEGGH
ncbi:MAG TPA: F0F1 ATP synthase subunit A [Acidimicrobiales bacterium]|nr:F0F1 ATP synthase subunit A [Acidimicrobiales bacterium]